MTTAGPANPRLVGVDVARGLAVLGMFGAHISATQSFDWGEPATWTDVVNGRSSILFAMLAGVSIALISGRQNPVDGAALARTRVRIVVRAGLIFLIGVLLMLPPTNIAIILPYYAVLFILVLPLLRMPATWLFGIAAVTAVTMPVLVHVLARAIGEPEGVEPWLAAADIFVIGPYPVLTWFAFMVTGVGIGRLDLGRPLVAALLLVVGTGLAIVGYGLGAVATAAADAAGPARGPIDWAALATTEPHSGSPFEVVGSTGFAAAVLGVCLLASRVIRWPLTPLAAVGSMALTTYTVQVLAIWLLALPVPGEEGSWAWLWFTIAALAACTAWRAWLGRGPLERLLSWASTRAARDSDADRLEPALASKETTEQ